MTHQNISQTMSPAITTLVFDGGETLMRVFPQYEGPMVNWPEVSIIEGVQQTIARLYGKMKLVVATNARDSSADQVRAALQRVGIAHYFTAILTYNEIDSRKPDPGFFEAICRMTSSSPNQIVMVGDEYPADMIGAIQAGWKAVWYNPRCRPCPGLIPIHQGEIHSLEDLPDVLDNLILPDLPTAFFWVLEQGASANMLVHVQLVAALCYQLALWLSLQGEKVNPILAHRGGLLHDLAKIHSSRKKNTNALYNEPDHGELAAQLLEKKNQPSLAEIARRHILFTLLEEERHPRTWEEKLVYFADKLVEANQIVQLEDRLLALQKRYSLNPGRLNQLKPALLELQADICQHASIPVIELVPRLREAFLHQN